MSQLRPVMELAEHNSPASNGFFGSTPFGLGNVSSGWGVISLIKRP